MNFLIAVVSQSYENCMEKKTQLIYQAKVQMIEECENMMPNRLFLNKELFPNFIIIRKVQGSDENGIDHNEWQGFVNQMRRHLKQETSKLKEKISLNH